MFYWGAMSGFESFVFVAIFLIIGVAFYKKNKQKKQKQRLYNFQKVFFCPECKEKCFTTDKECPRCGCTFNITYGDITQKENHTKECPTCGNYVDTDQSICHHCGHSFR